MPIVKSIQHGTLTIKGVEEITTKIIAVVIAKSELTWDGTATDANYDGFYHGYMEFVDNTTLAAHKSVLSEQEFIHWTVTEYE